MPNQTSHLPEPVESRTLDEIASHCFGCSPINPQGLHLKFAVDSETITARATVSLTQLHEGPPGYIHGGIIATMLDEAMSKVNRPLNAIAFTRNMQVDYLRPSPLNLPLTLIGRHIRREGRKLFNEAELVHPDGTVLARATGLFVVIDPSLYQGS